jgi:endonuclease YncB( thermonuclease family)
MMKKLLALLVALCIALGCLAGCNQNPSAGTEPTGSEPTGSNDSPTENPGSDGPSQPFVDYAAEVVLDFDSDTAKQEVTVRNFVDGDTTHFHVPVEISENNILKARYLAVNTPESTGKIEEWGKKASNFTKEKLSTATSIVVESDDGNWNLDSTGGRHLVWVWYRPEGSDTYRNLNIELLQNGLSLASNSAENRYGEICMAAIQQAKANELHIHSKQDDPDFYYGEAIPVTLKGLRTTIEQYENMKVTFEGTITHESNQTVYVEEYDEETNMYYGMTVYYGYNLTGTGLEILSEGNRVRIVGSVQYYATAGTWQVSDIKYVDMRPNDPNNVQLIESGVEASHTVTDLTLFNEGTVVVDVMPTGDENFVVSETFDYAHLALGSSICMEHLEVVNVHTTTNEDSSSKGAMTLTCRSGDQYVSVRTVVLRDADGNVITADAYLGKTITVFGIVDYFSGDYQIKVFSASDIIVE